MVFKKNWMADDKTKIMVSVMAVVTLWATVAIAGVNEDLIEAAKRGDVAGVKRLVGKGSEVNA